MSSSRWWCGRKIEKYEEWKAGLNHKINNTTVWCDIYLRLSSLSPLIETTVCDMLNFNIEVTYFIKIYILLWLHCRINLHTNLDVFRAFHHFRTPLHYAATAVVFIIIMQSAKNPPPIYLSLFYFLVHYKTFYILSSAQKIPLISD